MGKLQKGDAKKKKKRLREEEVGGLQMGVRDNDEEYVRHPPYSSAQIDCQSSAVRWRTCLSKQDEQYGPITSRSRLMRWTWINICTFRQQGTALELNGLQDGLYRGESQDTE